MFKDDIMAFSSTKQQTVFGDDQGVVKELAHSKSE